MGRPPKPFVVIQSEKKSHRTKAELENRKKAEESLATGEKMRERPEVKEDKVAHKEYKRIEKLLKNIEKNDDLFGACINRYCQLFSECKDFETKREDFARRAKELEERESEFLDNEVMSEREYYASLATLQSQVIALDKQIQAKRKMMFDYEKENLMTVAAGLRNIPKNAEKEIDPLTELLRNG